MSGKKGSNKGKAKPQNPNQFKDFKVRTVWITAAARHGKRAAGAHGLSP